jgi:hypothetical protein
MKIAVLALPLLAVLAGCNQSTAPSEQMEEAAEEFVDAVLEEPGRLEGAPLGHFAPRDECGELEGAGPFLAILHAAIEARDVDVLVALAANDVKLGFGGEFGSDDLRASLSGEDPYLWEALEELTDLGCAANGQGGLTLPWYFSQNIVGDPFETMIVTGEEVFLHEAPDGTSSRITALNWDAVEIIPAEGGSFEMQEDEAGESWVHVRALTHGEGEAGQEGYVRTEAMRSVIDYRLIASSRNGRWRITALLAGD